MTNHGVKVMQENYANILQHRDKLTGELAQLQEEIFRKEKDRDNCNKAMQELKDAIALISEPETSFNKGDVVRMKSGGPKMTAVHVGENGMISCNFFSDGEQKRDAFSAASLEHVS